MSVVSCSNSGTFTLPAPISAQNPAIITTATASGVAVNVFAPIVLPKGTYMISGAVTYTISNLANDITRFVINIDNLGNNVYDIDFDPLAVKRWSVPLSVVVFTDGVGATTVSATLTTTAGTYEAVAAASDVRIVKLY